MFRFFCFKFTLQVAGMMKYNIKRVVLTVFIIVFSVVLHAQEVKLLSYNVYFDDETGKTRYPEILKFIKQGNYNVIALQECTPFFLSLLSKDRTLRYFTLQQGSLRHGYTNVILTSLKVKQQGNINITSNMGRSASFIKLAQSNMMFVNVHLESGLFDQNVRETQLNTILDATKIQSKLMVVGDMNFADDDPEEELLTEFLDIGSSSNQLTYHTELNLLAQQTKYPLEGSKRLDRMFIKCKTCEIKQFDVQQVKHSDHWPVSALIDM